VELRGTLGQDEVFLSHARSRCTSLSPVKAFVRKKIRVRVRPGSRRGAGCSPSQGRRVLESGVFNAGASVREERSLRCRHATCMHT
jgi:hypothetical protein